MTPDDTVTLHDTACEELHAIWALEQREGRDFVMPYTLDRHRAEFARQDVFYKSIHHGAHFVGFVILALDPDGVSVELRRIVVSSQGRGIGRRAVELVRDLSKRALGRGRVWLDVFESNDRARRLYETSGFSRCGTTEHEGRRLLVYEAMV